MADAGASIIAPTSSLPTITTRVNFLRQFIVALWICGKNMPSLFNERAASVIIFDFVGSSYERSRHECERLHGASARQFNKHLCSG